MTNVDKTEPDKPVIVTGEERAHPAIRLLARAAIELARQQLAQSKQQEAVAGNETGGHSEDDGNREGDGHA